MAPATAPRVIAEEYFVYSLPFPDGIQIGTLTRRKIEFLQIEAESDFLIQKLAYQINIFNIGSETLGSQDVPLITVLITDTGSGRQMTNVPTPMTAYFGDGRLPYILPTPKLYTKATRLRVELFNFGNQAYTFLELSFQGKKIFTTG